MAIDAKTTAVPDILVATGRTLGQLNSIATATASTVTTINGQISSFNTAISDLEDDVSTLDTDVGALQTGLSAAESDIDALQSSATSLGNSVSSLDGRITPLETSAHVAVTLSGETYLSIVGQAITASDINLTTHVTGTLPIGSGGTGQTSALAAFNAIKQAASTTYAGVVELAADGEAASGLALQSNDSRLHSPVTVSGTPNYFTLSGQDLVRGLVSLSAHVTGTLPISSGGTGETTAAAAFGAFKQNASDTATGVVELATSAEVIAGTDTTRVLTPSGAAAAYQPLDTELTALSSVTSAANALPYFSGSGTATTTTLSAFGRTLIDDADAATAQGTLGLGGMATQNPASVSISGGSIAGITDLAIADGGTGASTAADAFNNLKQAATETATGVVELATTAEAQAGTDTTRAVTPAGVAAAAPPVTLAGSPAYLTISGQQITMVLIDLSSHVTGTLPISALGDLATATESETSHTNSASDRNNFLRWTNTGAKTYTINNSVASAGHVWQGINAAASGNLTIAAGASVTLTGNLIIGPLKSYAIRFTSASAADVMGGSAT